MGGNALKTGSVRLNREEFEELSGLACKKLEGFYSTKIKPLLFFKEKESFGDLDILIEKPQKAYKKALERYLEKHFSVTEIVKNKAVWSIGVPVGEGRIFQVDLIHMKSKNFGTAYFYYSYNDLNNLVGKMYHKFGLKFGHEGVTYPLRTDNGGISKKIIICKDPRKIYNFIGLSYDKWKEGFNNLEEIFEFVVSSPFFSADMFDDSNLTHRSRVRDKKRAVFQLFRDWLKDSPYKDKHYEFNKDKEEYLTFIDKNFPESNILKEKKLFDQEMERKRKVSDKFNGRLVMALTNLKGPELGKFLRELKEGFDDFEQWILDSTEDEIKEKILSFFKKSS